MMCRKRLLPFFLLLPLFLAGCGGGGGGGSNAGGPSEIAYVLSEDASAPNKGYIVEYGLDPATNNFQPAASGPVSTGGDAPLQLLFNTAHSLAFVLNGNNATDSNLKTGSVSVFSDGSDGLSASPVSTLSTGRNSVHMSLDPGGNYLVVADHGDGTGSNSGGGDVEIFSYSTSGTLSLLKAASSPCTNPFRVVFRPGSSGATSDTVYVVCSSPELVWETNLPNPEIWSCSITTLLSSAPSCTSIALLSVFTASSALVDFTFDPSGQYAVGPGTTSVKNGFLLVCVFSSSTLTCPNPIPAISSPWVPSGNIAFSGSGNGEKVYIGNYDPTGLSGTDSFVSCTLSNSLTHPPHPASSCSNFYSLSYPGPISMAVNPASNALFIAATVTAINGAYTAATPGTSTGGTAPSSGYLYSCPISSLTSCSSPQPTGVWPVELSFDPNGSYLFVPTLSGEVDIFTGVSSGNLSLFQQVSPGYTPVSVNVH